MNWLRHHKKGSVGFAAAKLDMSKAYDRVEWNYLREVMVAMNFPDRMVSLIMRCVSSVEFSFVVNRKVYGTLTPSRGLRQGCPLSPFLFVICAQGLSTILKNFEEQQLITGVRVARASPSISHLFFADDSLLFFKTDPVGVNAIQQALDIYSQASGQIINFDKSAISYSPNTKLIEMELVKNIMGIQETDGHSIYLGLPTFVLKQKRVQFDFIRERVSSRLSNWKNKLFSIGGREVLIKSVIQAIPTYTMACFRIPEAVCRDVERISAKFWWGGNKDSRGLHWSTWDKLCQPKSAGGVGFRKVSAFNQALLAKQAWRLIQFPNSLIAKVLRGRYYRESDLMDVGVSCNASFTWRSICWGRELLRSGLRWKINNGSSVRVFKDAWVPGLVTGQLQRSVCEHDDMRVSDLILPSGLWNEGKCDELLLPFEAKNIFSIVPAPTLEDRRFWMYDEKGCYSVKSGYLLATKYYEPHACTTSVDGKKWWSRVWLMNVPPKIRIFAWRALNDFIATDLNLKRHHIPTVGICSWCKRDWGSTIHSLIWCEKVKDRWKNTEFWGCLKGLLHGSLEDMSRCIWDKMGEEGFERWFTALWAFWSYLCGLKHDDGQDKGQAVVLDWDIYLAQFQDARRKLRVIGNILPQEGSRVWQPPRLGSFRLDVDVAFNEDGMRVGVGFIIRDHDGAIVAAAAQRIGFTATVLLGELHAMLLGIGYCLANDIGPIHLFSDSLLAVHVVDDSTGGTDSLCDELFEAFVHAKRYVVIDVSHVRREANRAAHSLANFAVSSQDVMIWRSDFPSWLLNIARLDAI